MNEDTMSPIIIRTFDTTGRHEIMVDDYEKNSKSGRAPAVLAVLKFADSPYKTARIIYPDGLYSKTADFHATETAARRHAPYIRVWMIAGQIWVANTEKDQ